MNRIKNNANNGIVLCDSIVMSVKRKHLNFRKAEAVLIAVIGYVSVIMSFVGMFDLEFNAAKVTLAAVLFSAFYISMTVIAKKALYFILISSAAFFAAAYKCFYEISKGFKFVYNVIYKASFKTGINYYKELKPAQEESSVTTFFIFVLWLMAIVIYFFTIYKPNPILPLLVTFPIIEVGLYNGIEIPVFWGILTIGYWLALLSMSSIDVGEYFGGTGGFVRKDNLFFPKRQMKLKVTEKCGIMIISIIFVISLVTVGVLNAVGYKRSDELNRKRKEISEAFSEFTLDDLAKSLSRITSAFGFTFDSNKDKLGSKDHISYKNVTELIVSLNQKYNDTIYLREKVSSVYDDNEWLDLDSDDYDDELFDDFEKYGIFPQDFPNLIKNELMPHTNYNMKIVSKVNKKRSFSPYGTINYNGLSYNKDMTVSSIDSEDEFNYRFTQINDNNLISFFDEPYDFTFSPEYYPSTHWGKVFSEYCNEHFQSPSFNLNLNIPSDLLYSDSDSLVLTSLFENRYREFVYDNYLQVPDDKNMDEVRAAFSDILDKSSYAVTPAEKIELLNELRSRVSKNTSYTLSPGKTPKNRDFVNYFLIENQKGYCVHYATSGVILARMAGIPARYASGYIIVPDELDDGKLQDDNSLRYEVKDNQSHAWVEIYIDGYGWIPYEFTQGYIEKVSAQPPEPTPPPDTTTTVTSSKKVTTSKQHNSDTKNATSVTTKTTSVTSVAAANVDEDDGSNSSLPGWLRYLFIGVVTVVLIVLAVFIRRKHILNKRRKNFKNGDCVSRLGYMYQYVEELLQMLEITNEEGGYRDFAAYVESRLGGKYIERGSFANFVDIALRSGFGNSQLNVSEMNDCEKLVSQLSSSIYEKSGFFRKIRLKIFNVLV